MNLYPITTSVAHKLASFVGEVAFPSVGISRPNSAGRESAKSVNMASIWGYPRRMENLDLGLDEPPKQSLMPSPTLVSLLSSRAYHLTDW